MNSNGFAKFKNDHGLLEIRIGVTEFECIGASPPHDHPHVYLNMGTEGSIRCLYCATLFRFDSQLGPSEADPLDSIYLDADETIINRSQY